MKTKFLAFILILLLSNCGFSPIYQNNEISNFKISIIETKGDPFLNKLISNEINKISKINSENKIDLIINSSFSKEIVSKDSRGSPSEYKLITNVNFQIKKLEKEFQISFNEKQNVKSISDLFEQKNYENTIKRNFASSIVKKLNLELIYKE